MDRKDREKGISGARLTKLLRESTDPREEQLTTLFNLPIIISWSDGHTSESNLSQTFSTEEDYKRYRGYKDSGKPYPVKVEAVELTEGEKKKPSMIFTEGSRTEDYEILSKMCEDFTESLQKFSIEPVEPETGIPYTVMGAMAFMLKN